MRKLLNNLIIVCAFLAFGMTAFAAPKTMPDGQLFDAEFYSAQHPEVAQLANGDENLLYAHYANMGKAVGWQPYDPSFDASELALIRKPATLGETNALKQAKNYLRSSAFSKAGLTRQLESRYGSGYTHEEAVYAVANCGANWYEQALKQAASYLRSSAYSQAGLIRQLESEYGSQFTHEEAVYAVANCGANWYEQAAKQAASYLRSSSFSRDGLIRQLESEYGSQFTHEEAVYGATAVGY